MIDQFDSSPMYARRYSGEPDWRADADTLFDRCLVALNRYRSEHPHTPCSFFAFDAQPEYGYVAIWLDTPTNALRVAQEAHAYEVANRYRQFRREDAWTVAAYYVEQRQPLDYADPGALALEQYEEAEFPQWQAFINQSDYPGADPVQETDYLEGHVRLIFWHVFERLVAGDAFAGIRLWAPFRLGYAFHDSPMVVVRILDWPQPS